MRRGDLVSVALQGDFGKPRPALVVQADSFRNHATVTVLLVTSELIEAPLFRVAVQPNAANGLRATSQVMVDKTMTIRRDKLGNAFGALTKAEMREVNRTMAVFLGIVG